jgi:hypothetical protein
MGTLEKEEEVSPEVLGPKRIRIENKSKNNQSTANMHN